MGDAYILYKKTLSEHMSSNQGIADTKIATDSYS